jgi:sugar transferase (PEP-CTERM/EpsH1 system associated)
MPVKVLLLTQVLPYPPDSGPKIKTFHVLRYLAERHEITLVSFVRSDDEQTKADALRQICAGVHSVPIRRTIPAEVGGLIASVATGQPWMMTRDRRQAMAQLIDRLNAHDEFDIAHADQLNMAQYAMRLPHARKVLDLHNALWLLYRRHWQTMPAGPRKWLLGRDWPLLRKYEGEMCRRFDAVLAVTEEDRRALREAAGTSIDISVIPIAVDTDALRPVDRLPDARTVLHIGTMYWPPNVEGVLWFAHEVWPQVKASVPDARFAIVGARPPRELQALAEADPAIEVTGYVADPTEIFRRTAVSIVPVSAGSGMRVKILEAFARGLPLVSTSIGFEGIAAVDNQHLLAADPPREYAQAVIRLLRNPQEGYRLSANARRLVETQYDYRTACRPLDAIYARLGRPNQTRETIPAITG